MGLPLVSDGASDSEESAAVEPEVRSGASVIVLDAAVDVGAAEVEPDAGSVGDGDSDPELVSERESVLDDPMEPRISLMFSDAAALVGWDDAGALDAMLLSEIGSYTKMKACWLECRAVRQN